MYSFPVPNTKIKIYQVFAYGIVLLNLVFMLYADYAGGTRNYHLLTIGLSLVLLFYVARDAYRTKKGQPYSQIGILILIPALRWVQEGFYPAFLLNILLWGLYIVARRNMVISVSEACVSYPTFPKKNIGWNELNQVILKDDILTLDLKNNKVYQHHLANASQLVNEAEFNDFCSKQLSK